MAETNPDIWQWIAGAIATLWLGSVGFIFNSHFREQKKLDRKIDECYNKIENCHKESDERVEVMNNRNQRYFVPKSECMLHNSAIGRSLDEIKTDTKEQQGKLEKQGLTLASIDGKLTSIMAKQLEKRG